MVEGGAGALFACDYVVVNVRVTDDDDLGGNTSEFGGGATTAILF